jgi:hypothetical protein
MPSCLLPRAADDWDSDGYGTAYSRPGDFDPVPELEPENLAAPRARPLRFWRRSERRPQQDLRTAADCT